MAFQTAPARKFVEPHLISVGTFLTLVPRRYAVRKVVFSPHAENILASCSYDMSVKLWDVAAPEDALVRHWDHHTGVRLTHTWPHQHMRAGVLRRHRLPVHSDRTPDLKNALRHEEQPLCWVRMAVSSMAQGRSLGSLAHDKGGSPLLCMSALGQGSASRRRQLCTIAVL